MTGSHRHLQCHTVPLARLSIIIRLDYELAKITRQSNALFSLLWYFLKLIPGSGLMKIFTTKYPFLWRHRTVFRNLADPRLEEDRVNVRYAGLKLRLPSTFSRRPHHLQARL